MSALPNSARSNQRFCYHVMSQTVISSSSGDAPIYKQCAETGRQLWHMVLGGGAVTLTLLGPRPSVTGSDQGQVRRRCQNWQTSQRDDCQETRRDGPLALFHFVKNMQWWMAVTHFFFKHW